MSGETGGRGLIIPIFVASLKVDEAIAYRLYGSFEYPGYKHRAVRSAKYNFYFRENALCYRTLGPGQVERSIIYISGKMPFAIAPSA